MCHIIHYVCKKQQIQEIKERKKNLYNKVKPDYVDSYKLSK